MHVEIDTARCEGHGLCVDAAPAVFGMDDDALVTLEFVGEVPAALEGAATAGARVCPVNALRVVP